MFQEPNAENPSKYYYLNPQKPKLPKAHMFLNALLTSRMVDGRLSSFSVSAEKAFC